MEEGKGSSGHKLNGHLSLLWRQRPWPQHHQFSVDAAYHINNPAAWEHWLWKKEAHCMYTEWISVRCYCKACRSVVELETLPADTNPRTPHYQSPGGELFIMNNKVLLFVFVEEEEAFIDLPWKDMKGEQAPIQRHVHIQMHASMHACSHTYAHTHRWQNRYTRISHHYRH